MTSFFSLNAKDIFQELPFQPSESEQTDRWLQLPMGWDVKFVDWLAKNFSPNAPSLVIDPYCGAGATLLWAARRGYSALGIDRSAAAVVTSYAKTHCHLANDLRVGLASILVLAQSGNVYLSSGDCVNFLKNADYSLETMTILAVLLMKSRTSSGHSVDRLAGAIAMISADSQKESFACPVWTAWGFCEDMLRVIHMDLPAVGPWLVLGSPPHPNSRGGLELPDASFEVCLVSIASDINARYGLNRSQAVSAARERSVEDSVDGLLAALASIAPDGTVVVLEYEVTRATTSWPSLIADMGRSHGFADSARIPLYSSAPDGRSGVVEGGILTLRQ